MFPAQAPNVKSTPLPTVRRRHEIFGPNVPQDLINDLCDADFQHRILPTRDGTTWREWFEIAAVTR